MWTLAQKKKFLQECDICSSKKTDNQRINLGNDQNIFNVLGKSSARNLFPKFKILEKIPKTFMFCSFLKSSENALQNLSDICTNLYQGYPMNIIFPSFPKENYEKIGRVAINYIATSKLSSHAKGYSLLRAKKFVNFPMLKNNKLGLTPSVFSEFDDGRVLEKQKTLNQIPFKYSFGNILRYNLMPRGIEKPFHK